MSFALEFGTEIVAPVEVGLKSPRIEFTDPELNDESLHLNLDILEEKREQALRRVEDYQRKTARYYDQKVRPNNFKPGDLVLKNLLPTRKDPTHGKLGPNWEGPYVISRIVRPSNYELQTEEGKPCLTPGTLSTSSNLSNRLWTISFNKTLEFYFHSNKSFCVYFRPAYSRKS